MPLIEASLHASHDTCLFIHVPHVTGLVERLHVVAIYPFFSGHERTAAPGINGSMWPPVGEDTWILSSGREKRAAQKGEEGGC